jgi:hypothetical protein
MKKSCILTPKEKEFKIGSLTLSLKEFLYGFQKGVEVGKDPTSLSHQLRFYQNSIYQYISIYFLLNTNGTWGIIFKTLKEVDLENLGQPFRGILSKKIEKTTFANYVRRVRNKILTHGTYSSGKIPRLFLDSQIYKRSGQEKLACYMWELYDEIKKLHDKLMKLLPENAGY